VRKSGENSMSEPGCGKGAAGNSLRGLAKHNFLTGLSSLDGLRVGGSRDREWDSDPDIWLYRKKTTAILRRYMRWSLEAGRVPSVLGRELFRAKITAFTATTFEERVIFLHDVEMCLDRLQDFDRQIIARVCLQEYDHEAAARILQCTRRTLLRRLPELIDELSEAFLKAEILERIPETSKEGL
jgi:DNA-directed RNA polymerase specialized sigma24 family protein